MSAPTAGGGEIRLIPVEIESLMLLAQKVTVLGDKLIKGEECLTMQNTQVRLLLKAHHVVEVVHRGKPDPKRVPAEIKKLLATVAKVQYIGVTGYQRPPGESLAQYTEEEAREEEQTRRCVTVLDLRLFAGSLRTLHLSHMDVKRGVVGVADVVELILTDTMFECSMKAFSSLRSVNFDRCTLHPKHLATLSYAIRSFSVSMYQRYVDPPLWRPPTDEDLVDGMVPWESLTYVSIRGARGVFKMDTSWGDLTQLRHLSVTHVQLTTLKALEIVGRCGNLVSLDVSHNKLDSLQSLSNIGPGLVKLNMSYNRLNSVQGIANLPKLRELNIEGNDVSSWVDIRDIADGCLHLTRLTIKGNPITRQGQLKPDDVNPFAASIFQFRSGLIVDGESTGSAKSKANPKFLTRFLPLFNKTVTDDVDFDRRSGVGSMMSAMSGGHYGGDHRHRSNSRGATTGHFDGNSSRRSRTSSHFKDPLAGKRSKMLLDRNMEEGGELPPEPGELPENPEDAIFRRLNIPALKEKYGEKWQEQAVILAASAYRDFQGVPQPLPDEAPPKRKRSPSEQVAGGDGGDRPSHRRRRHHKSHHHDASPEPGRPAAATAQVFGSSSSRAGPRQISDEGEERARQQMAKFREQLRESANRAQTTVSGIPRKEVEKPPAGTFATFLEGIQAIDWRIDDTSVANGGGGGKKKNVFVGTGVNLQKSQLCEENGEVWGMEDPTMFELGPSAMEVMLYDNTDNPDKVRNRFENKTLLKVVDQSSGYNRYVKLYVKAGPKQAKGTHAVTTATEFVRPMLSTVLSGVKDPTQPVELGLEVLGTEDAQRGGGVMSATRRSGFFANSERGGKEDGDDHFIVEGGGAADRQMFRVTKPRVLACFVVPSGPASFIFVDHITNHLKACAHSRLCVSGITHLWPRTFQAGGKGQDDPLKVKMDSNYIKEKAINGKYKDMNIGRQRVGTNLAVKGEDLFLTLQTYVFDSKLVAKENTKLITYTNLLDEAENANGDLMEWEESVLLIVTNNNILIANDRNERKGNVKNPAEYFPDCRHQPLSCLSEIEVDYDLQAIKLDFSMDLICKLKTRDRGVTLSIISAIMGTKDGRNAEINVRPCRIPFVLSVPIAFVVGVFARPPKMTKMKRVKDNRFYPLRETKEAMIPVRLILTASEVALVKDPDMDEPLTAKYMQPYTEQEMSKMQVARRTLGTLSKIRVAGSDLFPLCFGFEFGEGAKKEVWTMTAQHPNAIQAIEGQVKRQLPGVKMGETSLREHQG